MNGLNFWKYYVPFLLILIKSSFIPYSILPVADFILSIGANPFYTLFSLRYY